jgi:hypothetical protein
VQLTATHASRRSRRTRPASAACGALACVALLHAGPAVAEQVQVSYHSFSDSHENHIDSYVLEYMQGLGQSWSLGVRGWLDRVRLAPLPGLPGSPENLDAITAASRPVRSQAQSKSDYVKDRQEATGTLTWAPRGSALAAAGSYYVSVESDYLGQQLGGEVSRGWNAGSTILALRSTYGFDRIAPDVHLDGDPAVRHRTSVDLTATCTQSLSPVLQAQVGAEVTAVHGFQNNPYRQVYAGGQKLPELHPDSRLRRALFAQIDRYITTRASASLGARWYGDDWGVQAGTFDVRFSQYIGDRLIVRYRYRYHTQTAATFYRDLYADANGIDGYRSADYKLQDFDSNLFGVKVSVPFEGAAPWLAGLVLDAKYERYFDSNSFAANVLEAGFSWPF